MTITHRGSCQCGRVRYQITGKFERFYLCHCQRCRKDTGSAHAANLFATHADLSWTEGADCVRTYRAHDSQHQSSFCRHCGTPLPGLQMDGSLLVVPAGSLDTPVGQRPDARLCTTSRADWDRQLDDVPTIEHPSG